MIEPLLDLSLPSLKSLSASLRSGPLALGVTTSVLQQIAGERSPAVKHCLEAFLAAGMSTQHVAIVVDALVESRERMIEPSVLMELVLSGPDVPGVPTSDTAATMHSLIQEARSEILMIGYAVHNAKPLFAPLAKRMIGEGAIKVVFCLDISRKHGDTSLDSEIVRRFADEFSTKHWPWRPLPELYYDPRSLAQNAEHHSSLHAKCVVSDRKVALITSANFTEAAQQRNIEAGLLVRHATVAERVAGYFEGLRTSRQLVQIVWR
jgi:phosphatidylserine/phosphatidylglycerophosphate/cardiolipin synthase-like enzyme